MTTPFHIIIPARYASTRLTNKLTRMLGDKILLQHTYERALQAGATSVTIATDHPCIAEAMTNLGASVLMTSDQHQTGTDRLAEAAQLLKFSDDALVVNVQGDEPLIPVALIRQVAKNLADNTWAAIATLYEPMQNLADVHNPAIVKVVVGHDHSALYFSRAPIPFDRDQTLTEADMKHDYLRHLGLYAYRTAFLKTYQTLSSDVMERLEKLEQLRALHHGYKIHIDRAESYCPPGIDTLEDFERVARMMC